MNFEQLHMAIDSVAVADDVDANELKRLALRLIIEMSSEARVEILGSSSRFDLKDWVFVAERAARAIQLASDFLQDNDDRKPPHVKLKVKSLPKIRQLYWCDFPTDAHLPEFWKRRPVIIMSFKHSLHGAVTIIPCSTQRQDGNGWAVELQNSIDGRQSWAICDKLSTVAVSRLISDKKGITRLDETEFNRVLKRALEWLPVLPRDPSARTEH